MPSTVISEAIITIAVVVAASILAVTFTVNLQAFSDLQKRTLVKLEEEMETSVKIIFADAETSSTLKIWIKNVGYKSIAQPLIGPASDLFLEQKGGTALRVSYNSEVSPTWTYTILNDENYDGNWDPQETMEIIVSLTEGTLVNGDWLIWFATYTGSHTQYILSL